MHIYMRFGYIVLIVVLTTIVSCTSASAEPVPTVQPVATEATMATHVCSVTYEITTKVGDQTAVVDSLILNVPAVLEGVDGEATIYRLQPTSSEVATVEEFIDGIDKALDVTNFELNSAGLGVVQFALFNESDATPIIPTEILYSDDSCLYTARLTIDFIASYNGSGQPSYVRTLAYQDGLFTVYTGYSQWGFVQYVLPADQVYAHLPIQYSVPGFGVPSVYEYWDAQLGADPKAAVFVGTADFVVGTPEDVVQAVTVELAHMHELLVPNMTTTTEMRVIGFGADAQSFDLPLNEVSSFAKASILLVNGK